MTRVVTELRPTDRPFGVDFLWDARAALAIGRRDRRELHARGRDRHLRVRHGPRGARTPPACSASGAGSSRDIAIFMNVTPEFASPLGSRGVGALARSATVSSLADAILISGPMAGSEPDIAALREAREAVDSGGARPRQHRRQVDEHRGVPRGRDGCIVGSDLKVDGYTWNPVDPERVRRFVKAARG